MLFSEVQLDSFNKVIEHLISSHIKITDLQFDYSLATPNAITYHLNKYDVLLTLNKDIVSAINVADEFYKKENTNKSVISNYIDMRYYPEKLYFK